MAEERSIKSVFVGNIPYEATEEQLKEIFSRVGPVASFRLVYDRETAKPKGYGFCEYQDQETAQSAMRNLNNFEIGGRPLRVGVAAGDQAKEEAKPMQQSFGGPIPEIPYGEPVEPEKAPEAISRAVASLPPEQMFELMKQMKLCIQNNPNEARSMLLQNAQLAYALLQGQIVMKIVDPQVALAMLHRPAEQIPPVISTSTPRPVEDIPPQKPIFNEQLSPGLSPHEFGSRNAGGMPRLRGGLLGSMPLQESRLMASSFSEEVKEIKRPDMNINEPRMAIPSPVFGTQNETGELREGPGMGRHWRNMERQGSVMGRQGPDVTRQRPEILNERQENINTTNMGPPNKRLRPDIPSPRGPNFGHPRGIGGPRGGDMRSMDMGGPGPLVEAPFREDRYREGRVVNHMGPRAFISPRGMNGGYDSAEGERRFEPGYRGMDMGRDMSNMRGTDPRRRHHLGSQQNSESRDSNFKSKPAPGFSPTTALSSRPNQEAPNNQNGSVQDQEKAALIMQILQLSDEQIANLEPDQRQSILNLKEQIASARGGNL